MKKSYKQMLENASELQYLINIASSNEWALERHGEKYIFVWWNEDNSTSSMCEVDWEVSKQVWLFLLKSRTLRSGLATPMARYYAWKALNRKEDGSNE